ncbi:hypothetical protein L7F22_008453 [Adiantum nelumboides]|nr:hypothetical protein [Adiantum nelumboides]
MAEVSCNSEACCDVTTATGAASVSGPVAPLTNYDVFLNHRGPDVKRGFLDHLAASLESVGVRSFVDRKDLHGGDTTWDAIQSAIHRSKVHIAIFSPLYASSKWCLDELLEILECRTNGCSLLFLPVFFNVNPSDLRYSSSPKSCYSDAFAKLLVRHDEETILSWRNALHEASMVTGKTFDKAEGICGNSGLWAVIIFAKSFPTSASVVRN